MQLRLRFQVEEECWLPINYNYACQSMIYSWLSHDPDYSKTLHDLGYVAKNKRFKLFTFSQLRGPYRVEKKSICFPSWIELDIRSADQRMLDILIEHLRETREAVLGNSCLQLLHYEVSFIKLEQTQYLIQMASPLVVHETDTDGKTRYLTPLDPDFSEKVSLNAKKKYLAYFGQEIEGNLVLEPDYVGVKQKVVTKYKDFYITGWRGTYSLSGPSELLDFLYHVGLGEKNSMGFGMFSIKQKEKNR